MRSDEITEMKMPSSHCHRSEPKDFLLGKCLSRHESNVSNMQIAESPSSEVPYMDHNQQDDPNLDQNQHRHGKGLFGTECECTGWCISLKSSLWVCTLCVACGVILFCLGFFSSFHTQSFYMEVSMTSVFPCLCSDGHLVTCQDLSIWQIIT